MYITSSSTLNHSVNFRHIENLNDFVEKIHKINFSSTDDQLCPKNTSEFPRNNSVGIEDEGYFSDSEKTINTQLPSRQEFREKLNRLKQKLTKCHGTCLRINDHIKETKGKIHENEVNSLINKGKSILEKFSKDNDEIKGYANFIYRQVKLPEVMINNQQEKNDFLKNFTSPKVLTAKKGSKIPLKAPLVEKPLAHATPSTELIKYKRSSKYANDIVYVHYRVLENNQYNKKSTSLPKSTFEFKGNIQQTQTSLLRAQRIKERYKLSNKSAASGHVVPKHDLQKRASIKKPDMTKVNDSINKEKNLKQEIKALEKKMENEIKNQSDIINRLSKFKNLKKQPIKN